MPSRILYFCKDYTDTAGGVRNLYTHVAHLNRNGLNAFMVHQQPGFRPGWFPVEVPILYLAGGLQLQRGDLAIIPEDYPEIFGALGSAPLRKVIFCQNHFYALRPLAGRSWRDFGVSGVIAASRPIADFVQTFFGFADVPVVHCSIDANLFAPRAKTLQVAYMPRKRPFDAEFIRDLTIRILGPDRAVPFVKVEGYTEQRTAAILGESAAFLALGSLEGFGLPPIEAMSCRCAVVGFHGNGGVEYATGQNGIWCADGDVIDCAQKLALTIEAIRQGESSIQAMLDEGSATAASYTAARQEQELLSAITPLLKE